MKCKLSKYLILFIILTRFTGCGYQTTAPPGPTNAAPTVSSTFPLNSATSVAINVKLAANFNRAMDPATLTLSTFFLMQGTTPVLGVVTYTGLSATFSPIADLSAGTLYTATVSSGATDLSGKPLVSDFSWSFTTGASIDATPPTVSLTTPTNAAVGVAINLSPSVTFSEAMDPTSISPTTFELSDGTSTVAGQVTYFGLAATFTPASAFSHNTLYTATIGTGALDLAGNALENAFSWTFTTGLAPDTTSPTVLSTTPAAGATGVAFNMDPTATFSEAMDATTVTTATFTLTGPGTTPIVGVVSYIGAVASFSPLTDLSPNTLYTATIFGGTNGAKDLAGNALVNDSVWSFTTGLAPDTTSPTVLSITPTSGTTGVAFNVDPTATFSEAMDATTLTTATFTLTGPGTTPVVGVVSYIGGVATFSPLADLSPTTLYTATILGGTNGAKDLAGNALTNDLVWTFTTDVAPDTTPPTMLTTTPPDAAVGVCIGKSISASFSEPLDETTLTPTTFTVTGPGSTSVSGTRSYDSNSNTVFFNSTSSLASNTLFTVTLVGGTNGIKDLAGNALSSGNAWTFSTGSQPCSPVGPISLGAAATFGGAGGGAGMTNSGTFTVINGDIATTGASTMVTGFHDNGGANSYTETLSNIGNVTGRIYTAAPPPAINDGTSGTQATFLIASAAIAAATDAWTNTLSPGALPGGTDPNGGQLGGLTLAPGVYRSAGGPFVMTGSDLTLDGQGDPNAIWVFQSTALTVGAAGAPRSVNLIGGAQAKNVFWRCSTAATINAAGGGTMVGTILADAGVTFSTAGNTSIVTLNGRALGLQASVTMVNTVINVPAP